MELKWGDRVQVLTELVIFITLPFPFSSKLKSWSFHVVFCGGTAKTFAKKRDALRELLFFLLNLFSFFDFPVTVATVVQYYSDI